MGLIYDEKKNRWEWEGSVQGLVDAVGSGDARLGAVVDKKSGAKISINISDSFDEVEGVQEPFYVESPSGEMLYDAYNRKEAVKLLSNIRKGLKYPDMDTASLYTPKRKAKAKPKRRTDNPTSMRGIRR